VGKRCAAIRESDFCNLQLFMPQPGSQTVDPGEIDRAAQLLRAGSLVAFPTESQLHQQRFWTVRRGHLCNLTSNF
jgi:hypothetical protein